MKKYIAVFLLILSIFPAFSQIEGRRRPFGITVGFSMKNAEWKDIDYRMGTVTKEKTDLFYDGYGSTLVSQLGFTIVPEFKNGFGIQTGIHFEFALASTYEVYWGVQIPIRLQYRYEFPAGFSLLAYTGPNIYCGLYDDLNHPGCLEDGLLGNYWSFGGGVQYKGIQFRVTTDMLLWQYNDYPIVRSPLTFSLSYLF